MRGAKSGDRVIGSSDDHPNARKTARVGGPGDRKIKGFADGPMTLWSDGPILPLCLQSLYRLEIILIHLRATRRLYYVSKVLIPCRHSHGPDGHATYTSSPMQREKQNTLFEQWLVAYETRLIQICTAPCKEANKPEPEKNETDLSPEVTSE
jgi:hypothetical protein